MALARKRAAPQRAAGDVGERRRKWRRRAGERPDEILDAALDEFVEKGFAEARVEDIAARAAISKAGVYLYFDSKEDILRALIEREIAPIARRARTLAEAGIDEPLETLCGLVGAFATVLSDPRVAAVPRIVLSVVGRFPEIADYYRENVVDEAFGAVAALHRAGVAKGVFRDADSAAAARAVIGPIFVHLMYSHVLGGDPGAATAAERAEAQIDLLLNGLAADPAKEAA